MRDTDQPTLDLIVKRMGVALATDLLSVDVFTISGRNGLVRAIDRAKEADERIEQIDLTLADKRTLQGEVDAGRLMLVVYMCPDCGSRIEDQLVKNRSWPPRCFECNDVPPNEQSLMDGKPMAPVDIPVRKLPDAFKHLDSSLRRGIDETYLRKLARAIEQQRQAMVRVSEAGFAHNARVILRFAAARAGVDFDEGAIRVLGEGQDQRVHFYVDPAEGIGAA